MATEIEAKMRVDQHDAVVERLRALGGEPVVSLLEENIFFDTPGGDLTARGCGMRVRLNTPTDGSSPTTRLTYKGPKATGEIKSRREIEFGVDDMNAAAEFLHELGYIETLRFEKRRSRWRYHGCMIELDEMPRLGRFVEIEGPDEQTILSVRAELGLGDHELITRSYAGMLAKQLESQGSSERVVRFTQSPQI